MALPGILMQIAKSNPMMQRVKQMMDMVKSSNNPSALINQMMMNNPNMKYVMDLVNKYNGNAEFAFRETAEKMGVNPEDVMDLFK